MQNKETLDFLCNCVNFSSQFFSKLQNMTIGYFVTNILEISDEQLRYKVSTEIHNSCKNDLVLFFTKQDDSFKKRVIKKILFS